MQDCHWQEALSMITWVTEDLCISAQCSRQGEFSSLDCIYASWIWGISPSTLTWLYLFISVRHSLTPPLHFNTSGWRSDSSPAVPAHHQWVWEKNYTFHSKATSLRSSEAQLAVYKAVGSCQELLPALKNVSSGSYSSELLVPHPWGVLRGALNRLWVCKWS